jgi:uncharacterized protein (TIGR02145 family)
MAENLRTATYANGDPIENVTDNTAWTQLNTGAWCNTDNNTANDAIYGKLYNYYTTVDSRGLCPTGWHVPSDVEWTNLISYLGGIPIAGGKMKSTAGWNVPNIGATNESSFSGLPGSIRIFNSGNFGIVGDYGYWWSSTEYFSTNAWSRVLGNSHGAVYLMNHDNRSGFSVRCLRD